jgi:hypothetical protein
MDALPIIFLAGWAFLFLLAILWALVPFAIFGIKPILRDILAELRKRNGGNQLHGGGK